MQVDGGGTLREDPSLSICLFSDLSLDTVLVFPKTSALLTSGPEGA